MTHAIELFYSSGSCSLAPHIALEESGLAYTRRPVVIANGGHRRPEYLAVNPRGRVPALRVNGEVITEAPAVLATIADLAGPGVTLLPFDAMQRGRALEWLGFLSSSVHIGFAQLWRPERFLPAGAEDAAIKAGGEANIARFFGEIEERVGDGPWLLGGSYSVADPFLVVFWRWGTQRLGWDMEAMFPRWSTHTARLRERPAVGRVLAAEGVTLD